MIPAAGQGILAVQGRKELDYDYLEGYRDPDAWDTGRAERAFVKFLDGGCSSPVAAYGEIQGEEIFLRGLYYIEETGAYKKGSIRGNRRDAEKLGITLAKELQKSCKGSLCTPDNKNDNKGEA